MPNNVSDIDLDAIADDLPFNRLDAEITGYSLMSGAGFIIALGVIILILSVLGRVDMHSVARMFSIVLSFRLHRSLQEPSDPPSVIHRLIVCHSSTSIDCGDRCIFTPWQSRGSTPIETVEHLTGV